MFQSYLECIFITDNLDPLHESYYQIVSAQDEFGDMRFQNLVDDFMFGFAISTI